MKAIKASAVWDVVTQEHHERICSVWSNPEGRINGEAMRRLQSVRRVLKELVTWSSHLSLAATLRSVRRSRSIDRWLKQRRSMAYQDHIDPHYIWYPSCWFERGAYEEFARITKALQYVCSDVLRYKKEKSGKSGAQKTLICTQLWLELILLARIFLLLCSLIDWFTLQRAIEAGRMTLRRSMQGVIGWWWRQLNPLDETYGTLLWRRVRGSGTCWEVQCKCKVGAEQRAGSRQARCAHKNEASKPTDR